MSAAICVAVVLPDGLARQFPPLALADGQLAEPHITVAYLPGADRAVVEAALLKVMAEAPSFPVVLTGGVHTFAPTASSGGRTVVCAAVQSEGLLAFRLALLDALGPDLAALATASHAGYVPHATLAYLEPGATYEGPPAPAGEFMFTTAVIWGGTDATEGQRAGLSRAPRRASVKLAQPRQGAFQAVGDVEPPPVPAGTLLHNPGGLHVGRAFRTMTADEPIRDAWTGDLIGIYGEHVLREFVRVFASRVELGDGPPRIDINHGPSRNGHQVLLGEVIGLYVADDGLRGPGLYVIPGYTDHGRDYVAVHRKPQGGSILSSSPELVVAPVYARGGGDPNQQGALLGGAEILGVALTGSPQQSERTIDPVSLARQGAGTASQEGQGMPGENQAPAGGEQPAGGAATAGGDERLAKLEAENAELKAMVEKGLGELAEMKKQLAGAAADAAAAAGEKVDEITAEALAAVEAKAEEMVEQLSAAEVAELDEETPKTEAMALSRVSTPRKARVEAFSRRAERAQAILGKRELRAAIAELSQQRKEALDAKADRAVAELRQRGLSKAREQYAREQWLAKHDPAPEVQAYSKRFSKHPWDELVDGLARSPDVPLGIDGRRAPLSTEGSLHTVAAAQAWAKTQNVSGTTAHQVALYCRHHNISDKEITQ